MTDKIMVDGKKIGCPCYIDRPLYKYDKGCLIQSQAFSEQQTKEKPILRCDEIQNCPIKNQFKLFKRKKEECIKLSEKNKAIHDIAGGLQRRNHDLTQYIEQLEIQLQAEKEKVKELEKRFKTSENWRIRAEDMNEKFSLKVGIYKQALEEIRQIVIFSMEEVLTLGQKNATDEILQKCEVLNDV